MPWATGFAKPVAASATKRIEEVNILAMFGIVGFVEWGVRRRQPNQGRRDGRLYIGRFIFTSMACGVMVELRTSLISSKFPGYVYRLMLIQIQGSSHFSVVDILSNLSTAY